MLISDDRESDAMRKILIIGIGAGDPEYVTVQAINALNRVDAFFIPDKGTEKEDLARLRLEICERYIRDRTYRLVDFKTPARSHDCPDYKLSVQDWHSRIEQGYETLLAEELGEGECGAFLVWGDPTLYDSTLRIIEKIKSKGNIAIEYEVIPGISSVQALAAKHRIALNRIGEPVHITTGRKLAEGFPDNADTVVVMSNSRLRRKRQCRVLESIAVSTFRSTPSGLTVPSMSARTISYAPQASVNASLDNGFSWHGPRPSREGSRSNRRDTRFGKMVLAISAPAS